MYGSVGDAQTLGAYGAAGMPGYEGWGSGWGAESDSAAPIATGNQPGSALSAGTQSPDFWAFLVLVAFLFFTRIAYEWSEQKPGQS